MYRVPGCIELPELPRATAGHPRTGGAPAPPDPPGSAFGDTDCEKCFGQKYFRPTLFSVENCFSQKKFGAKRLGSEEMFPHIG